MKWERKQRSSKKDEHRKKRWWGEDKRNSGTESTVRGNERQRRETTVQAEG